MGIEACYGDSLATNSTCEVLFNSSYSTGGASGFHSQTDVNLETI